MMDKKTWVPPTVTPLAEARDAQSNRLGLLSDGLLGSRASS